MKYPKASVQTIELTYLGVELSVNGTYTPGYPAPATSNPDDPGFSDPGSPSEFEISRVSVGTDSFYDLTPMLECLTSGAYGAMEDIAEKCIEKIEGNKGNDYDGD